MKKIVALLMTAVMTIGMATAAFAAPSPQPTTGTIVAGKNASGQDVDLSKVKTSDNYSTNDAPEQSVESGFGRFDTLSL